MNTYIIITALIFCIPSLMNAQFEICNSNTNKTLTDIYFIDENIGIAVGDSGIILRSVDEGLNWNVIQSIDTVNFTKVKFFDSVHGISIGSHVFVTQNSGVSWQAVELLNIHFNDIEILNDSSAIISGYPNRIYKTYNYGNDWELVISDTSQYGIGQMSFINKNIGYALHLEGSEASSTLKTNNGGEDWFKITDDTGPDIVLLEDISFISEETGFRGGWYNPHLMKTNDGGVNWNETTNADSANSWPYWASIYDFHIEESQPFSYYACGWYGEIFKSIDGGNSWNKIPSPVSSSISLFGIYFIDEFTGWAVGDYGVIIRTNNGGGLTNINEVSNKPDIQFLPNPFDQIIHIKNISNYIIEEIHFFDETGKLIFITNQNKMIQTHSLPPGIYGILIKTNQGFYTDKLIKK